MKIKTFIVALSLMFLLTILSLINVCYSTRQVQIEFLYFESFCQYCPDYIDDYQAYCHNKEVVENIQNEYGENVTVKWILFNSEEGVNKRKEYGLSPTDWNCIVVDHKFVFGGGAKFVNETDLRQLIDYLLAVPEQQETMELYPTLVWVVAASAFTLGFFESFSPCVLVMLSFIVSYTLSDKATFRFKEAFLKIVTFGVGFVFSSIILSWICSSAVSFLPSIQSYLTLVVCFLAIVFGLNLLGLLKFPEHSKPLIRSFARKYVLSYAGIFLLGLMFYFLDPCLAPIFASVATLLFSNYLTLALILFLLGAFLPFVITGLLAASISKITRKAYQHRFLLRGLSGAIVIGYASYLFYFAIKLLTTA
jgi:cytochrome c-type biogenesis protein